MKGKKRIIVTLLFFINIIMLVAAVIPHHHPVSYTHLALRYRRNAGNQYAGR